MCFYIQFLSHYAIQNVEVFNVFLGRLLMTVYHTEAMMYVVYTKQRGTTKSTDQQRKHSVWNEAWAFMGACNLYDGSFTTYMTYLQHTLQNI